MGISERKTAAFVVKGSCEPLRARANVPCHVMEAIVVKVLLENVSDESAAI